MNFFKKLPERLFFLLFFFSIFGGFFYITRSLRALPTGINHGVYARQMLLNGKGRVQRALFSPDHNVKQVLRGLIQEERRSVSMAIFTLTDQDIADDLIKAKQRGIHVEIITDEQTRHTEYSKIPHLIKNNIKVFSCPKKRALVDADRWQAIMHNKFVVFGWSITARRLLWTGSFNFTRSANDANQENVLVIDDQELCMSYLKQFELLKQRSKLVSGLKDSATNSYDSYDETCEQDSEVMSAVPSWLAYIFS